MALTRFTARQLEAFLAVADAHSFSAAADRLGMTAQAVSPLVAELESVLGFRRFDRTTRRVMLSSAGRDFLASAATAVRHLQAAKGAAADVRNRATNIVRVGAPLVLAATALPAAGARVTPVDVIDNITPALGIAGQGRAATLAPAYVGVFARQLGLIMRRVLQPETVRQVCLCTPLRRSLSPAAEGHVARANSRTSASSSSTPPSRKWMVASSTGCP